MWGCVLPVFAVYLRWTVCLLVYWFALFELFARVLLVGVVTCLLDLFVYVCCSVAGCVDCTFVTLPGFSLCLVWLILVAYIVDWCLVVC